MSKTGEEWSLTSAQMAFMLQHIGEIEAAYAHDDIGFLNDLESSAAYGSLFADMPWDEAFDRFEET